MRLLQTFVFILALGAVAPFACADDKSDKTHQSVAPPNVVLIMIDDLNDWVGALGGHPQVKTPNLDRLISQGVLFSNAHCAAPVCGASRHALMSGLRPSTTGWYTGGAKTKTSYERILGETVPMPTHFKQNGYKTMAAGKVFHRGTSDLKDYDFWDETRPRFKWPDQLIARGHGYKGRHFYPFPRDGGGIYQLHQKGVDGQSLCWGALEKEDIPAEGMPDEQIAEWAVERLQQQHDKPFFLAVGFIRPHVPYTAPQQFFDLYPIDDVKMPQVPADEMGDIPLFAKAMAYGTLEGGDHKNVLDVGPDYWKEMVRAYLACVSFADAQAGKVLRALDESPYADNTIVVFVSDHGQHLGEKRSWRKQDLWEEATRVPLSIRFPKSHDAAKKYSGQTNKRASSLIDIYPTLVELCDLPQVKGLEGTSLMHRLADIPDRPFEPVITTWHYNNHSVRGWKYRYTQYRDGTEELYNHLSDSGEHHNLAGDPKYARTIRKYRRHLPKTNVVPASMEDGGTDSFDKKVARLESVGVPSWLGGDDTVNDDISLKKEPGVKQKAPTAQEQKPAMKTSVQKIDLSQSAWYEQYKSQQNAPVPAEMLLNTAAEPSLIEGFKPLFNGKDLAGWKIRGGTCQFKAEEGVIIGTCVPGSQSTYLCTDREDFTDFLFTCDIKWEVDGNTGVMFRAKRKENKDGGELVFGPQAEMEGFARERGWSGGIYGQSCGGYFYPLWLQSHEKARNSLDKEKWNRLTISAKGNTVKTWVNGVPAAHWQDEGTYPSGYFGLQIHKGEKGTVHFRNLQIKE